MDRSLAVFAAVVILGLGMPVTALADSVNLTSDRAGSPIEPSTSYSFLFEDVYAPTSAGTLTVTETNGDFNAAGESISVMLESIDLGMNRFKSFYGSMYRTLSISFALTLDQMKSLAADGDIGISLTTSAGVDQSVGSSGWKSSWGSGTSWLEVSLAYEGSGKAVHSPEPGTWMLMLAGCGVFAWRVRRRGKTMN